MQLPYSNLQLAHQNPGASAPLILPIQVICNTSDEALFDNIRVNSRRPGKWVKRIPVHERMAVLCGSGPSLRDSLSQIKQLRAAGGIIFAMNGAAAFLADHGLLPDYQIIIDAREETAQLVGPAKAHLFGSQVHPETFKRAPGAQLWHLQIEGIDDALPEYNDDWAMIGGAASVGNCATCLAYVLGYRQLEIFGYDSSYRGAQSHAFDQPMNLGEPRAYVTVNDQQFLTSLTMKLQAEKFMTTAAELKRLGCSIAVHGDGLLPTLWNNPLSEKSKYQMMWSRPDYRTMSPGEQVAETFIQICRPKGKVVDFGCGTGRGSLAIQRLTDCELLLVDFASNSRDPEALALPFVEHDLREPMMNIKGGYAFCTDVLEHIPPEDVDAVILNIMDCVLVGFFQISLVDDVMGGLIGQPLHLSVHPAAWWRETFERLNLRVIWSRDLGEAALFFVSKD